MEFDLVIKKRLNGMTARLLANIEHTVGVKLNQIHNDEQFTLTGADLNIIRNEILNAAGDTTRSLAPLVSVSRPGQISFSRNTIAALNRAEVDILETSDIPLFKVFGDFHLLHKIRGEVGAGVVYNKTYTCVGIDDIVDSLIPFLDSAQIAGIKIADGEYCGWRDAVCELYLEELGDE